MLAELHLAQWHGLLALKRVTESELAQKVVVAYTSHTVMVNYFPYEKVTAIDLLLDRYAADSAQGHEVGANAGEAHGQRRGDQSHGEATRGPGVSLEEFKSAIDSARNDPRPGLYRWLNNTPEYRAAATFIFYDIPISRPFVVYEPKRFISDHLANIKPPIVPSADWDKMYASVVDAGRSSRNRTAEMNTTAAWVGCTKIDNTECFPWNAIARSALPSVDALSLRHRRGAGETRRRHARYVDRAHHHPWVLVLAARVGNSIALATRTTLPFQTGDLGSAPQVIRSIQAGLSRTTPQPRRYEDHLINSYSETCLLIAQTDSPGS